MEITQEIVKNLFDYHEDGYLIWKIKPRQNVQIGDRAGFCMFYERGYRCKVKINMKSYFCSRIIFLWHKGYFPIIVDHKDRNKLNDKIENLRAATTFDNAKNTNSRKNSSSKYLGVYWHAKNKYWCAHVSVCGKSKHLGVFKNEDEAALAFNNATKIHYGEFANLNIV